MPIKVKSGGGRHGRYCFVVACIMLLLLFCICTYLGSVELATSLFQNTQLSFIDYAPLLNFAFYLAQLDVLKGDGAGVSASVKCLLVDANDMGSIPQVTVGDISSTECSSCLCSCA
jgi:hypothetical protein